MISPPLEQPVVIIGGGLAGCEAAWQLLRRGIPVRLYEMKPERFSPAHRSEGLAELVCSNSLRAGSVENAPGLLKEEMRRLDSLIMAAADEAAIPAGRALAVDRHAFSRCVEKKLLSLGTDITVVRREVVNLPRERPLVVAAGPLASDALAQDSLVLAGREYLYFYDAIAPIVTSESIGGDRAFWASRYEDGEGDYLNCPLTREEYDRFWDALTTGREVPVRSFEDPRFFEGCLPVEVMARRGRQTLTFGPMKPVGLVDPRTGAQPYAVVQLRREDREGRLLNLVGFQTKLTWPEQERIFRMIPGLEKAEFVRYGSIHRNTFLNAPTLLDPCLRWRDQDRIYVAGQIAGAEGYIESAAVGLLAGISVAADKTGRSFSPPPPTTAHGALICHLTTAPRKDFQPMNINFGLFPPLTVRLPARQRGASYARRALEDLEAWRTQW